MRDALFCGWMELFSPSFFFFFRFWIDEEHTYVRVYAVYLTHE